MTVRDCSIMDMMVRNARIHHDRDAVVQGSGRLTFGEYLEQCMRLAGGFRAAGALPGDRIALLAPNGLDYLLVYGAAALSGMVVVPVKRDGVVLSFIPFVFHGPRHSRPDRDKLPLADIIAANLDHYRLDADYKHGLHFAALPTAWVSGFDKNATLRIGASSAWVADIPGATAGFLEFTGSGLGHLERAMEKVERRMSLLGARMLEATSVAANGLAASAFCATHFAAAAAGLTWAGIEWLLRGKPSVLGTCSGVVAGLV